MWCSALWRTHTCTFLQNIKQTTIQYWTFLDVLSMRPGVMLVLGLSSSNEMTVANYSQECVSRKSAMKGEGKTTSILFHQMAALR
jgi:hypothetical protein